MPLQNRVNPYGEICFSEQRGQLMGNRGRLHNDRQEIVRDYLGKRWIICLLAFKDRHQEVMRPGRYTELFFLDEATALAAGHRPCAQCQYGRYQEFVTLWKQANQHQDCDLQQLDEVLHQERTAEEPVMRATGELPDGVFIEDQDKSFLVQAGQLWEWSFAGYQPARTIPADSIVPVLTPLSIVRTIAAGFQPSMHPSVYAAG